MLNKQELVNFINEKLNEINSNYKFNIMAEVGETKPGVLSGILLTNRAETTNIPNYDEINYSFTVAILVPSARTNKKLLQVENIIGEFCNTYDATEQVFGETDVTLTITLGKPDNLRTEFEIGDCVPLYFTINGLWGNNVTSTKRHWFLDGVEIPFESEGVYLQKDGRTNKIQGIYNTQTLPTGVTKQYRFIFPYSSNFSGLQQDLLSGDFKKIYTLTYYDGVSYTEENPFSAKVSIFASGDNNSARTRAAKFNITFTDVDDGDTEVKYWLGLIDNPFDNQTEDTRWFNSQQEQRTYFEQKLLTGCQYEQIKAPNLNSLDITSQVYENTQNYDMLSLVNKNYAIIKITQNNQDAKYLYYFVQSCQIGANNQFLYDLKLDTIQTYLFNPDLRFSDCFIEKANLNRWIEVGGYELLTSETAPADWSYNYTSYYYKIDDEYIENTNSTYTPNTYYKKPDNIEFDGTLNSKLFTREDFQNLPKRMTSRKRVGIYNTGHQDLDEWLNTYIYGYIYVYLDPTHAYKFYDVYGDQPTPNDKGLTNLNIYNYENYNVSDDTYFNNIVTNEQVVCIPLYNNNGRIVITSDLETYTTILRPNMGSLDKFFKNNAPGTDATIYDYVLSMKFSILPPFTSYDFNYEIDNEILRIEATNRTKYLSLDGINVLRVDGYTQECILNPQKQYNKNLLIDLKPLELNIKRKFIKSEMINSNKNWEYNPKLLNLDYKELKVSDQTENGYSYDIQKLNTKTITLRYIEPLTPDATKKYIGIKSTGGIYIEETVNNLTGFITTDINSLTLPKDAYSSMLANNKNFFLQNSTNRGFDVANNILGIAPSGFGALVGGTTAKYGAELSALKAGSSAGVLGAGASAGLAGAGAAALFAGQVVTKIGGMIMNNIQQKANEGFTIDNLKNAPGNIQQAKGDIFFETMYSNNGIIVEEWDILPNDKEIVNDYMVRYGYNTNLIGNPFDYMNNDIKNGRRYFNYIKAQIQNISGVPMSNVARADIRERFDNGLRFWNDDRVNYSKENYETWIAPIRISRVVLKQTRFEYDGQLKMPEIEAIYDENNHTIPRRGYFVFNSSPEVNRGTYTIQVAGQGQYKGVASATWEIY